MAAKERKFRSQRAKRSERYQAIGQQTQPAATFGIRRGGLAALFGFARKCECETGEMALLNVRAETLALRAISDEAFREQTSFARRLTEIACGLHGCDRRLDVALEQRDRGAMNGLISERRAHRERFRLGRDLIPQLERGRDCRCRLQKCPGWWSS
jgi:hypothetical protein